MARQREVSTFHLVLLLWCAVAIIRLLYPLTGVTGVPTLQQPWEGLRAMLPSLQRALRGRRPRQATQQQLYSDSEVGRWVCPAAAGLALAAGRRSRAVAASRSRWLLFPPTRRCPLTPHAC